MAESSFVYVTYIRATPNKVWESITTTEFMKSYFFGFTFETGWTKGAPWRLVHPDGSVTDSGEIMDFTPPSRLELSWRNETSQELLDEGYGRCAMDVEPSGDFTKLTVTHTMPMARSKTIAAISQGWPMIMSNLKSVLEVGDAVV